ncbi:MAG: DegT/DnrJ/EryC1/StrS family aminotransferase [Candidatus Binatia bacterium]|nr:DegT/DnrJ/EryC1/StrS family aminotransferase [Candidatus Binatia bacterium]
MPAAMPIPLARLQVQHERLRAELVAAFARVLDSSQFVLGPEVEAFEREFAAWCGVRYAVGVANGTDALVLGLRALGVRPGDAVAVPAITFAATAEAVRLLGARPVFVDVEPAGLTLDAASLRAAAERVPLKAVIAVHLYGQPARMEEILAVATDFGLRVLEDAAQAHGAALRARPVGTWGQAAAFSFYPTKNLGALGDAGAVVTNDPDIAERVRLWRDHGQVGKYEHVDVGCNSRLDALQAAWLRVKLPHLATWNTQRRALAKRYRKLLAAVPGVQPLAEFADSVHVYHQFVVRCRDRARLAHHLQEAGIGTAIHYPTPLHLLPAFAAWSEGPGSLPVSEQACEEVLALPLYPEMTEDEVDQVCRTIAEVRR